MDFCTVTGQNSVQFPVFSLLPVMVWLCIGSWPFNNRLFESFNYAIWNSYFSLLDLFHICYFVSAAKLRMISGGQLGVKFQNLFKAVWAKCCYGASFNTSKFLQQWHIKDSFFISIYRSLGEAECFKDNWEIWIHGSFNLLSMQGYISESLRLPDNLLVLV